MTMRASWRRELDRESPKTAIDDHWHYMAELWGQKTLKQIAAKDAPSAGRAARMAARFAAKIKGLTK